MSKGLEIDLIFRNLNCCFLCLTKKFLQISISGSLYKESFHLDDILVKLPFSIGFLTNSKVTQKTRAQLQSLKNDSTLKTSLIPAASDYCFSLFI